MPEEDKKMKKTLLDMVFSYLTILELELTLLNS